MLISKITSLSVISWNVLMDGLVFKAVRGPGTEVWMFFTIHRKDMTSCSNAIRRLCLITFLFLSISSTKLAIKKEILDVVT